MKKKKKEFLLNKSKNNLRLTDFQCQVLRATLLIPMGETRSYEWVAKRIGRPRSVRAVGQALKNNPYPIIIPCHRVIRKDGCLSGYVFGSRFKKKILDLEDKAVREIFGK